MRGWAKSRGANLQLASLCQGLSPVQKTLNALLRVRGQALVFEESKCVGFLQAQPSLAINARLFRRLAYQELANMSVASAVSSIRSHRSGSRN
jgi:hypothetical protein